MFTPSTFPNYPKSSSIQVKLVLGFQINRDPQMKDERTANPPVFFVPLGFLAPCLIGILILRTKLGAMARTADLVEEMGQVCTVAIAWIQTLDPWIQTLDPWIQTLDPIGQLCFLRQDGNPHRKRDGLCTLLRGDTMENAVKSINFHCDAKLNESKSRFDTLTPRFVMKTKMPEIWATSERIPS